VRTVTSPAATTYEVILRPSEERVVVHHDDVVVAAHTVAPATSDRVGVEIDGLLVEPREVVAAAIKRPVSEVPLRQAVLALERLGFPLPRRDVGRHISGQVEGPSSAFTTSSDDAAGGAVIARISLDRELSRRLRRYVGRWVAVRDGEVVADGDSLSELLEGVQPDSADPVTVLFVPTANASDTG
jgi:hypothetical protein